VFGVVEKPRGIARREQSIECRGAGIFFATATSRTPLSPFAGQEYPGPRPSIP
jgi:hypothetical protein